MDEGIILKKGNVVKALITCGSDFYWVQYRLWAGIKKRRTLTSCAAMGDGSQGPPRTFNRAMKESTPTAESP